MRQRSDYTFKFNRNVSRHGWLRLTPAYSVKLVNEILDAHPSAARVFDPFSGTGTTALCAAQRGLDGFGTDINPFLVWLGNTKLRNFTESQLNGVAAQLESFVERYQRGTASKLPPPPIFNIERWWHTKELDFLCAFAHFIREADVTARQADLLRVILCRSLINLSNAAFNHQSMSFKDEEETSGLLADEILIVFRQDVESVLGACVERVKGAGKIELIDSRQGPNGHFGEKFDIVITSPPYPNRMSYIRELRPYMYWLEYLKDARQAGEIDWQAIGGTWGTATSKLNTWKPTGRAQFPKTFFTMLGKIAAPENANGRLLATYIHKYFDDIWDHVRNLKQSLKPGATLHYIVGNSTFYGTVVPVEEIYADIFRGCGLTSVSVEKIRKRNSKKELFEFRVCAVVPTA